MIAHPSSLLDHSQLDDIAGQAGDNPESRELLGRIWRDSLADVRRELEALDGVSDAAALSASMHRVRGLLSMWGVRAVSERLRTIEFSDDPVSHWERSTREVLHMLEASRAEIAARHEWLTGRADG